MAEIFAPRARFATLGIGGRLDDAPSTVTDLTLLMRG